MKLLCRHWSRSSRQRAPTHVSNSCHLPLFRPTWSWPAHPGVTQTTIVIFQSQQDSYRVPSNPTDSLMSSKTRISLPTWISHQFLRLLLASLKSKVQATSLVAPKTIKAELYGHKKQREKKYKKGRLSRSWAATLEGLHVLLIGKHTRKVFPEHYTVTHAKGEDHREDYFAQHHKPPSVESCDPQSGSVTSPNLKSEYSN